MSKARGLPQRMAIFEQEVTVYPVSCEKLACGRSDIEWLQGVLAGGARIVQLRDKISTDREVYEKAVAFRRLTNEADALLIINNRVDIALAVGADGVHLGNSDFPAQEARKLAPELIIGVSANTREQAASAEARGASYFNIGPIFPTRTKGGLSRFLGLDAIPEWAAASPLPHTVMGGITFERIGELIAAGAKRLAVVTAITRADDIAAETEKWVKTITRHRNRQP